MLADSLVIGGRPVRLVQMMLRHANYARLSLREPGNSFATGRPWISVKVNFMVSFAIIEVNRMVKWNR